MLGKELQITCTATNDEDAPLKLMFSWGTPNNVKFTNVTTNEDNNHKATSTLHIGTVTRNHNGEYRCIVRNGEHKFANSSNATAVIIEGDVNLLIVVYKLNSTTQSNHLHLKHSTLLTLM